MVRPENLQCLLLLYNIVWCVTISIFHTQYSRLLVKLDDVNWTIQRHSLLCFIIKAVAEFQLVPFFIFLGLKFVCVLYVCVCTGMDIHKSGEDFTVLLYHPLLPHPPSQNMAIKSGTHYILFACSGLGCGLVIPRDPPVSAPQVLGLQTHRIWPTFYVCTRELGSSM